MNKRELITQIIAQLTAELKQLTAAALATHAEATAEENKAEDKYDTRSLEASYLAQGQSNAARETAQSRQAYEALVVHDFAAGEAIGLGALVALEGDDRMHCFIGPRAGGTEVVCAGRTVMAITPQSPLGRQLMGRRQGDTLQLEFGGRRSEYRVLSVG